MNNALHPQALSAAAAAGRADLAEAVHVERVRVQDDRRALAGERLGDRAADAVRRARHQRPLVLEQQPLRATLHLLHPCSTTVCPETSYQDQGQWTALLAKARPARAADDFPGRTSRVMWSEVQILPLVC